MAFPEMTLERPLQFGDLAAQGAVGQISEDLGFRSPADEVHDAGLRGRTRPRCLDGFGEPGEPITAHDEHVSDAAIGELGAHSRPELGALGGPHPDPQHML